MVVESAAPTKPIHNRLCALFNPFLTLCKCPVHCFQLQLFLLYHHRFPLHLTRLTTQTKTAANVKLWQTTKPIHNRLCALFNPLPTCCKCPVIRPVHCCQLQLFLMYHHRFPLQLTQLLFQTAANVKQWQTTDELIHGREFFVFTCSWQTPELCTALLNHSTAMGKIFRSHSKKGFILISL